jgi:hypothetical protein
MMRLRPLAGPGLAFLLAACTATPASQPVLVVPPVPLAAGLDRVIGKDARALQILFGEPDLDVREPPARKLQYAGPICVLDAYLYPPAAGREPVVRYIDARLPNGDDFDRASCIAALSRRKEAR